MKFLLNTSEKIGNFGFWRILTNFWTVVFYIAITYDFFSHNALDENHIILAVAGIYCASLAIYSAEKEFRRWHHMHQTMHPGEMYALLWTLFIIALITAQVTTGVEYHMPPEVSASYIAVISILALTRESKNMYKRKGGKRN
ncbi:MAG TPA: hypothetical protein VGE35_00745 [Candidatus Paceibacterota bacterium]